MMDTEATGKYCSLLSQCDLILVYKNELFVALVYNNDYCDAPVVICKGEWDYYINRLTTIMQIPIMPEEGLTKILYDTLESGDLIPQEYYNQVAVLYSLLTKFKSWTNEKNFKNRFRFDVSYQLYQLENSIYKKAARRYFKKNAALTAGNVAPVPSAETSSNQYSMREICKRFASELSNVCEKNDQKFWMNHVSEDNIEEIYIYSKVKLDDYDFDFDFWNMIFVSEPDQKIYVCSQKNIQDFGFDELENAIGYVSALAEARKKELIRAVEKYCREFTVTPKMVDITQTSINTLLEMNYKQQGVIFGYACNNIISSIYLKAAEENKMYEIVITTSEFMRNPDALKEIIKNPKCFKKWNFWCRKRKFDARLFEEKFQ